MEQETGRRETGDLQTHMAMMQVAQTDMMQQLAQLQDNFSEVVKELAETKRKQDVQQQMTKNMLTFLQQRFGDTSKHIRSELSLLYLFLLIQKPKCPQAFKLRKCLTLTNLA